MPPVRGSPRVFKAAPEIKFGWRRVFPRRFFHEEEASDIGWNFDVLRCVDMMEWLSGEMENHPEEDSRKIRGRRMESWSGWPAFPG
jgi:hypothetical protein